MTPFPEVWKNQLNRAYYYQLDLEKEKSLVMRLRKMVDSGNIEAEVVPEVAAILEKLINELEYVGKQWKEAEKEVFLYRKQSYFESTPSPETDQNRLPEELRRFLSDK